MTTEHKEIVSKLQKLTAEGVIDWHHEGRYYLGVDKEGTQYCLNVPPVNQSKRAIHGVLIDNDAELRVEGNGMFTVSIVEKHDSFDRRLLEELAKSVAYVCVVRDTYMDALPLDDEEFQGFLISLADSRLLTDYPWAVGIIRQLTAGGRRRLTARQMQSLVSIVEKFAPENCEACGTPIPWSEKLAAYQNGGYCALHDPYNLNNTKNE